MRPHPTTPAGRGGRPWWAAGMAAMLLAAMAAATEPASAPQANTVCPVMAGNAVDRDVHVDYRGKRVYFCCADCKAAFLAEPAKYLAKLPQFAAAEGNAQRPGGRGPAEAGEARRVGRGLIEPLGAATFALLVATVCLGLFRRRSPKAMLAWHKRLGIGTLIVAACHALAVFLAD